MPFENEDPSEEPQGRAINIRFSRDTLLLVGALGFLVLALVLAFLIPTGSDRNGATPTTGATLSASGPSVTPGGPTVVSETAAPGGSQPGTNPYPSTTDNGYPLPTGAALRETSAPGLTPPPTSEEGAATSATNLAATESVTPGVSSNTTSEAQTPTATVAGVVPTQGANPYPGPEGSTPTSDVPTFDPARTTATTNAATETPVNQAQPTVAQPTVAQPTLAQPTLAPATSEPIGPTVPVNTRAPSPTRAPPTETPIPSPTSPPLDIVKGTVHWTPANGPIVVRHNLSVPHGATLIIDPGTEVKVAPGASIFVDGSLQSLGRPDAPVHISSLTGQRWEGIFGNPHSTITLDTTYMSGAGSGGTMLTSEGGELLIRGSRFNNNGGTIYINNSRLEMRDTEIAGNDMPYGSALNASYDIGNFVILHGNRISGNRLDPGAPNVRIANTSTSDTLNLNIEGNYIVGGGGGNLLLSTDGPIQGQLVCNTLRNDAIGLDLRSETKQIPGFNLLVRNNFFDDHTPTIVPDYLKYGIGRGAASEVVLDMRGNWWGNASGPYHPETNPQGSGEAVGANIDYRDWLNEPPSCAPHP